MLQRLFWCEALVIAEGKTVMQQVNQVFDHLGFIRILDLVRHAQLEKILLWLFINRDDFDRLFLCDLVHDNSHELKVIGDVDGSSKLNALG
jgi:hypothetical protein